MAMTRRGFLRISGLAAGTSAAGLSLISNPLEAKATMELPSRAALPRTSRPGAGVLLNASSDGKADSRFIESCEKILTSSPEEGGLPTLKKTVALLWYGQPIRLYSVAEADAWLRGQGYFESLDFFVRSGGHNVAVLQGLNPVDEPQYSTDPRALGYLSHAIQKAYWNAGHRQVYTLFPGPSGVAGYKTGSWHNGFWEYFSKYDMLRGERTPRTFGEVYGKSVDPAIADRTMLWHSGRGVFDHVSWNTASLDADHPATRQQLIWLRESVDPSAWVYFTNAGRPVVPHVEEPRLANARLAYHEVASFRSTGPYVVHTL